MNAAVASGFLAPGLGRRIQAASGPAATDMWRIAFRYNGEVNQAYALVFVVASSVAIVLWSVSILRGRVFDHGIAYYGCVLGPATPALVLSGHLSLGVHGFGMIVLGQTIWFVIAAVLLWRTDSK